MPIIQNATIYRVRHGDLTIEGYSRAAMQSYWRVPELDVGFDLGAQPMEFVETGTWCVSHCHLDHVAALPMYVWQRRRLDLPPPLILLPQQNVAGVRSMLAACGRLSQERLECELVGLAPGDEVELTDELAVSAFSTRHTVPSLGFAVCQRRANQSRLPVVVYTGDTAPEGLDANPIVFEAKILITEMTFVDPRHRRELIRKHGHLHLDDFVERAARFKNELIIAAHVTARSSAAQVRRCVARSLPLSLQERLAVWV